MMLITHKEWLIRERKGEKQSSGQVRNTWKNTEITISKYARIAINHSAKDNSSLDTQGDAWQLIIV